MSNPREDEQRQWRRIVESGIDIAGAGTGAQVGALLGDPMGAAQGAMYGTAATIMLKDVALDFAYRLLGRREEERVGAVVRYFADKYESNLNGGDQLRQDGFFDDPPDDRATAKEVFEGVLLAAQREHEEKKLRFFGNLMANLPFAPEYDRAQANLYVRAGQDLSYRQMCALALFRLFESGDLSIELRQKNYREGGISNGAVGDLLQEINDLNVRGMVFEGGGSALISMHDINPSTMQVRGLGYALFDLMELYEIEDRDLDPLVALLQ